MDILPQIITTFSSLPPILQGFSVMALCISAVATVIISLLIIRDIIAFIRGTHKETMLHLDSGTPNKTD